MGEAADASDGSKKAALFVKAVKVKIGSLEAPKLDQEMLGFVAEHLGSDAPFKAILGNNSKGALALRKRRLAFLTVKPYAELCDDLNNDNPTCGCEKPGVSPCIRVFVYGAFREILVMYHMYDNIRNGGEGINPDGYYRAFGAHADQIHLATGGLAAFLTQGEPTVVSLITKAMDAVEVTNHGVQPIAPMQFSHLHPAFVASHDLKRGREQEGMVQQTMPPYSCGCVRSVKGPITRRTYVELESRKRRSSVDSGNSDRVVMLHRHPQRHHNFKTKKRISRCSKGLNSGARRIPRDMTKRISNETKLIFLYFFCCWLLYFFGSDSGLDCTSF